MIGRFIKYLSRNRTTLTGKSIQQRRVNFEYWNEGDNIGDYLSRIVFDYMLEREHISEDDITKRTTHLMGIGSIIAEKQFDATIWGSGIHTLPKLYRLYRWQNIVKYDIRAVRGPLTCAYLTRSGYDCSNVVFGDPAALMPLIYMPDSMDKKYDISIVAHYKSKVNEERQFHYINVCTEDYKFFIDEIVASRLVIASSLHGIILAEAYGVPVVFWNDNGRLFSEIIKYYDWYYSTNRYNVIMAMTIEDALRIKPMELPNLERMQKELINSFPYDLWR